MFKHYDKSDHKTKELYDAIEALTGRISFLESKLSDSEKDNTILWRQVNKPITSYGAIKLDSVTLDIPIAETNDGGGNTQRQGIINYSFKITDYGLTTLAGLFFCSVQFIGAPTYLGACMWNGSNYVEGYKFVGNNSLYGQVFLINNELFLVNVNITSYNVSLPSVKIRMDFGYVPYK